VALKKSSAESDAECILSYVIAGYVITSMLAFSAHVEVSNGQLEPTIRYMQIHKLIYCKGSFGKAVVENTLFSTRDFNIKPVVLASLITECKHTNIINQKECGLSHKNGFLENENGIQSMLKHINQL